MSHRESGLCTPTPQPAIVPTGTVDARLRGSVLSQGTHQTWDPTNEAPGAFFQMRKEGWCSGLEDKARIQKVGAGAKDAPGLWSQSEWKDLWGDPLERRAPTRRRFNVWRPTKKGACWYGLPELAGGWLRRLIPFFYCTKKWLFAISKNSRTNKQKEQKKGQACSKSSVRQGSSHPFPVLHWQCL